ncbi:MAG: D-alanyl-D-alanine carboxypeptidase [Fimbriimonadaceae bacterium]|nr:D-alanyl-D-alanine carboxypeptidase [Fimbriimonadaceae bacterium]
MPREVVRASKPYVGFRALLPFGIGVGVACAALGATADAPTVTALSAIAMDAETGRVLFEKDADAIRYPASTTKVMTALLMIERLDHQKWYAAPKEVETVTGSSLYMKPGERLRGYDLIQAVMLRSANDAAVTGAVHISGSVEKFCQLMNERAKALGCENTHFNNPHGLNDDLHTTTARDLALITREAIKNPLFNKLARMQRTTIHRPENPQDAVLVSKNHWLRQEPTADGIKTGYTDPAGRCFIGSATRNGFRVITVVLKSEDTWADTAALTDWCFDQYRVANLGEQGKVVTAESGARVELLQSVRTLVGAQDDWEADFVEPSGGEPYVRFVARDGWAVRVAARKQPQMMAGMGSPTTWALVALLVGGAYAMRRKSRRISLP